LIVLGLTGSIGMGKTTVAKEFIDLGFPVFEADSYVHYLLENDDFLLKKIKINYPDCFVSGKIDRDLLANLVFNNSDLDLIEEIIHPLVNNGVQEFIKLHKSEDKSLVVIEMPLLIETGTHRKCDVVILVTASEEIQKKRVLKRKNMSIARFNFLISRQLPGDIKIKEADFVIDTEKDISEIKLQIIHIANTLVPQYSRNNL